MLISELNRISGLEMLEKYSISKIYPFPSLPYGSKKNLVFGCPENEKFNDVILRNNNPNYILKIKNGIVIDGPQKLIDPDGNIWIADETLDPSHSISDFEMIKDFKNYSDQELPTEAIHLKGRSLLLESKWSNNYYHFTVDCLGRAMIASKYFDLNWFDHILVKNLNISYVSEYLLKFNSLTVDTKKYMQLNSRQAYICDELYVPSYAAPLGSCSLEISNFLNENMSFSRVNPGADKSKIFIGRRGGRAISNQEEISSEIKKFGFETIYLEDLSVLDQIHLFNNAKTIIAPHGAALTNLIYQKNSAKVFELFPSYYVNPLFFRICLLNSHTYNYFVSDSVSSDGNFYIPKEILIKYINLVSSV